MTENPPTEDQEPRPRRKRADVLAPLPRMRSLLFAPASRPDVCAKLPRSDPHGVVLDLEDAVAPAAKAEARVQARASAAELRRLHPDLAIFVRVNPLGTEWFAADVAEGLDEELTGIVVPKLEMGAQVDPVLDALIEAGRNHLRLLVGVETAAGVANVAGIDRMLRHPRICGAYFGAEDFITDMGGVRTDEGLEVLYARSQVALAARLARVPVLDQVVAAFGDDERFLADAAVGRSIGYSGKLCIHPSQVPLANQCFSPSPEERERARALLAVWEEAQARGEASVAFEGQMVDEPLARRARALLDE
ncbi:HpcH/HpaI aldolase/citrate lyase family protein [Candidatus Poriferisocius sp.]|uniref:HpcH/HpaI aldolase/citrate lyase family protein n=1 Tax=Candidatus Poriferisocius sp. TaxID=3101276 RepID=UPI003B01B362